MSERTKKKKNLHSKWVNYEVKKKLMTGYEELIINLRKAWTNLPKRKG